MQVTAELMFNGICGNLGAELTKQIFSVVQGATQFPNYSILL